MFRLLVNYQDLIISGPHLYSGRTIYIVTVGPAGPYLLNIFGLARPLMYPDQTTILSQFAVGCTGPYKVRVRDCFNSRATLVIIRVRVRDGFNSKAVYKY